MNAWDIEDVADQVMNNLMTNCHRSMTPEQRVDFLMYLSDLIDYALKVALLEVPKN